MRRSDDRPPSPPRPARTRRPRWTVLWALPLLACAVGRLPEAGPLEDSLHADRPRVGLIWSSRRGQRIELDELVERLRDARFVLLGERHDDPEHHRLQARLLERLAADGRSTAVVFEMLEPSQQPVLDAFARDEDPEARTLAGDEPSESGIEAVVSAFAERVRWSESGWPDFSLYRPIFEVVFERRLPILAAGLPRAEALPPEAPEREPRFGLDEPLPPEEQAARVEEMWVDHCEEIPRERLDAMVERQRERDVRMARLLLEAAETHDRAVLIAGNGHVRRGRVDAVLARAGVPSAEILSVGPIEVDPDRATMADAEPDRFDFAVFTAAVDRGDPCEALREGR